MAKFLPSEGLVDVWMRIGLGTRDSRANQKEILNPQSPRLSAPETPTTCQQGHDGGEDNQPDSP